jgi:hypothetical protein
MAREKGLTCQRCGNECKRTGQSQKDCPSCRKEAARESDAERSRRYYRANREKHRPMCERSEELTEALQRIVQWADAYPTDIFHEPSREECNRAHTVLKVHGMTLDA